MDDISLLREFPIFARVGDADVRAFAALLKESRAAAGTDIMAEGDSGSSMHFLVEGTVDIIKTTPFGDRFVCATFTAAMHCVFGEMALMDNDRRSATVRARTDCRTLYVEREDFDAFTAARPLAGVELLKFIGVNLVRNIRKENENLALVYQALIEEIEGR